MAGQSTNGWAICEGVAKEQDPIFSFPIQPPSLEFRYPELDFRPDFAIQDIGFDPVPLMECFPTDPLYSSLDIIPSPAVIQGDQFLYLFFSFRLYCVFPLNITVSFHFI